MPIKPRFEARLLTFVSFLAKFTEDEGNLRDLPLLGLRGGVLDNRFLQMTPDQADFAGLGQTWVVGDY